MQNSPQNSLEKGENGDLGFSERGLGLVEGGIGVGEGGKNERSVLVICSVSNKGLGGGGVCGGGGMGNHYSRELENLGFK